MASIRRGETHHSRLRIEKQCLLKVFAMGTDLAIAVTCSNGCLRGQDQ